MNVEGEITIWQGNPSWKSMLLFYVKWTLISLVAVGIWAALTAGGQDVGPTWFTVATAIGLVLTYIVGWIRRRSTRYLVTDRRIHIRTGLMSRHERTTHVDRVQNVNLRQSIPQRLLGIGDVDWDTAGTDAADADFTFRGVDDPSALVHAADRYYGVAAVHETAQRELQ
ncbi:MAG: PH domain-containing protein [Gaiellales bacterium]